MNPPGPARTISATWIRETGGPKGLWSITINVDSAAGAISIALWDAWWKRIAIMYPTWIFARVAVFVPRSVRLGPLPW